AAVKPLYTLTLTHCSCATDLLGMPASAHTRARTNRLGEFRWMVFVFIRFFSWTCFHFSLLRTLTLLPQREIQTLLAVPVNRAWRVSADTTRRSDRPSSADRIAPDG